MIKADTPVGTPASTGKPDYKITHALQNSIQVGGLTEEKVDIGTNRYYGPFVHQGTYDYAHGYDGWGEAQALEAEAMWRHNRLEVHKRRGMLPRPFLVTGLVKAKPAIRRIWGRSIN